LEEPSPHPRRRQSETPPLRRQDPQSPIGLGNLSRSTRISRDIYAGHLPPCSPCPLEPKRQPEGIGNGGAQRRKSFALFSPPLGCSTGEGETRGFLYCPLLPTLMMILVVVWLYLIVTHAISSFSLSPTSAPATGCSMQAIAHQDQFSLSQSAHHHSTLNHFRIYFLDNKIEKTIV
jgi:hypothetical protein